MPANTTPRKKTNTAKKKAVYRKRAGSVGKGGAPGKKKLTPTEKTMRKKKITAKEAKKAVISEGTARKIKRLQKETKKKNKPGIRPGNKYVT